MQEILVLQKSLNPSPVLIMVNQNLVKLSKLIKIDHTL